MPVVTFNSAAPLELQLTDYSCSVGATFWCLRSLNIDLSQQGLQEIMVPALVSPDDGLLDASGATIANLLRSRFGLSATNQPQVSFDDVAARAGKQPVALGGRSWHVDPTTGKATGHWVAVRSFDGQQLVLANPGGTGPNFGQQALTRDDFANRGPFSAVYIDVPARVFKITNTDGMGVRLRTQPDSAAQSVGGIPEGAQVSGDEHAWRHVTTADGSSGWVAEEYLTAAQ
jgi:Bacterial SH3 domain